jgi:hypothetical protein
LVYLVYLAHQVTPTLVHLAETDLPEKMALLASTGWMARLDLQDRCSKHSLGADQDVMVNPAILAQRENVARADCPVFLDDLAKTAFPAVLAKRDSSELMANVVAMDVREIPERLATLEFLACPDCLVNLAMRDFQAYPEFLVHQENLA